MKTIIFGILTAASFSIGYAQVPDSTRKIKPTPSQYRTDSVKQGNEVFNGNKTHKSKSNGDTLAAPRNSKKTGTKGSGTHSK